MTGTHEQAQVENPYAGQGAVMLDIGGDVGALVVEMPSDMVGREVEVRPAAARGEDDDGDTAHGRPGVHHPHVAVVDRPTPEGTVPSLVFAGLREGTYELCDKGGGPVRLTATVTGSEVAQLRWPT